MTQTLKFLTAQLEDRCHSTTSPKTTYFLFLSKHHGIFTDFSQLKVTGSPRWRERRCQDQLNHKPRSRSRHLGDSRCTRALEFSEFDLTGLPSAKNWFPKKIPHNLLRIFHKLLGLDVPFYLLGGLVHCSLHGILVGVWGGWGGCKNDISTPLREQVKIKNLWKHHPDTQLSEQWTRNWNCMKLRNYMPINTNHITLH